MAEASLSLGVVPTHSFFTSEAVKKRVGKMRLRNLKKFGAFVRRASKSSLRYAKAGKHSAAGQPPKVHRSDRFTRVKVNKKTGKAIAKALSPLRELIFFVYDSASDSVVIGPLGFKSSKSRERAPKVMERGGVIMAKSRTPMPVISGDIHKGLRRVPVRVAARPFMAPAAKREMPKFPQLFKGDL